MVVNIQASAQSTVKPTASSGAARAYAERLCKAHKGLRRFGDDYVLCRDGRVYTWRVKV